MDDATSTAPPRHTPEELVSIRSAIQSDLQVGGPRPGPLTSIGDGRDTVEIGLVPGREDLAAKLVQRYGDALRIHVGGVLYVPRGCGSRPTAAVCPDLVGAEPSTAGLQLSMIADTPRIKASDAGHAHLLIHNTGAETFSIDPGSPIVGSLVKPGTTHVVGENTFAVAGFGQRLSIAPGETGMVPVVFGAGRCDGKAGSALPPGRYGLRVVLMPEGPAGADLSPRLLSPATRVTVTG